jgi:5-methylcytosine-specific restriction endonuclease McrA
MDPAPQRVAIPYEKYLNSTAWQAKRAEQLAWCPFCQICGDADGPFQVHHAHYNTLGRERVGVDLTTLCVPCHQSVAEELRRRRVHELATPPETIPVQDDRSGLSEPPRTPTPKRDPHVEERGEWLSKKPPTD